MKLQKISQKFYYGIVRNKKNCDKKSNHGRISRLA